MILPNITTATQLADDRQKRLFIGAYGFEERSLGWVRSQMRSGETLQSAAVVRYKHPKRPGRINELRQDLGRLGARHVHEIIYDARAPQSTEQVLANELKQASLAADEIVLDTSAMTKLLILVSLCSLCDFPGTVRLVYAEPTFYPPTEDEYERSKEDMSLVATFPSRGVESIIRMKCLSSIRMQGQPVSLVAFTSFNEQLVRHMLGTLSPHRLIFINGRPPHREYAWREHATQQIHGRLVAEYAVDNPIDARGRLVRVASTLDYRDSLSRIDEVYDSYGAHERIICAATGSKMQIAGMFLAKMRHPDLHIEYPTPDSYFISREREGIRKVYQVVFPKFRSFISRLVEDYRSSRSSHRLATGS
jgi:hypothetical protein